MNTVTFPYLGLTFEMNPNIQIFGLNIAWYAVIIVAGMILAMVYVYCRIKQFGYDFDQIMEVLFFGIIGGIVGARLYYVIFSWEDYQDNLLEIFNTRNGGLAIYGGIIGALLAALIVFKVKKLPMIPFLDLAMIAFLLGRALAAGETSSMWKPTATLPSPAPTSLPWKFPGWILWCTPAFCTNRCGACWASCCSTSCPKNVGLMEKWCCGTACGMAPNGPLWKACGATA